MVIAVDFDGTIVEDAYPKIGEPKMFVFETLREIQKHRHQLILSTTRTGKELEEAIEFCALNGIQFYAVNNSFPEEKFDGSASRKLNCELFISCKNIGGIEGWGEIWQEIQQITGEGTQNADQSLGNPRFIDRLMDFFK